MRAATDVSAGATAAPSPTPADLSAISSPTPLPRATRAPVPTPSLKPGEFITWIKLDRPRFPIGEIIISSLSFVAVAFAIAICVGIALGHLRSKRRSGTHGAGGLDLR